MKNKITSLFRKKSSKEKLYSTNFILKEEKEFFENNYKGEGSEDFKYSEGSIPILISAPHSVKQIRNNEYKAADIYTGALIKTLSKTTNAHVIYKTKTKGDENYTNKNTPYREKIKEIVKDHHIKVVIDLHGMSDKGDSYIDIGTGGSNNKNLLGCDYILPCVKKSFHNVNYSENKYFSAKGELTLSHYCSHVLAVPTLQLEISRKYRSKESKNFSFMVNTLSQMIDDLNDEVIHHL